MTIHHSKDAYRAFCQQITDIPIFCYDWYLDAVVDGGEWGAVVLEDKGQLIAAWPYFHKRKMGLHYVSMPHFTKHMGILCIPELRHHMNDAQLQKLQAGLPRFAGIDQQFAPQSNAIVEQLPSHFHRIPLQVHQIDLAASPNWHSAINRNMRRNIRKASQQLQLHTDISISDFYQVNILSFKRQGISIPYTFDQLKRHYQALIDNNACQLFAAIDEQGQTHSVACLIWDQKSAYYHLSGDDPSLRKSGSGIWLIAQAITYTQEELQLPIFDFEGSMIPAVAAIREQFGAYTTTYHRIQSQPSLLYRLLKKWRA